MEEANPKAAAWDAIGELYWNSGYRGGPTERDIALYLAGVGSRSRVTIIGASTRFLIGAALDRGAELTVIDFSAAMIASLLPVIDPMRCRLVHHDITRPIPSALLGAADLVLADRLINRFTSDEIRRALHEVLKLMSPEGEFRTSIRLGLYKRDLPLIEEGRKRGVVAQFFDETTLTIDYGRAGELLGETIEDHGAIPRAILLDFYRLRGPEKRLRAWELVAFVAETTHEGARLVIDETTPMLDAPEDTLYIMRSRR